MAAGGAEPELDLARAEPPSLLRAVPTWLRWTCGAGCLGFGLLLVLLVAWTWRFKARAEDPELQWPRLQRVLPFDERPADLELTWGFTFQGRSDFRLRVPDGDLEILVLGFPGPRQIEPYFELDPADEPTSPPTPIGAELGTAELQGREVRTLGYDAMVGIEELGGGVRFDVSTPGRPLMIVVHRTVPGPPPTRAEAAALLAPFDVWRGR